MIGRLKGIVISISDEYVIVDVQGVGYLVYCTSKTLGNLSLNQNIVLFIETYVREDQIKLLGFLTYEDQRLFKLLNSVNGVGVKMALNALSYIDMDKLVYAISHKDKNILTTISGVGPRLAERIITELNNKKIAAENISENPVISNDAVSALVNLGINQSDAISRVSKILTMNPSIELTELIKKALHNTS